MTINQKDYEEYHLKTAKIYTCFFEGEENYQTNNCEESFRQLREPVVADDPDTQSYFDDIDKADFQIYQNYFDSYDQRCLLYRVNSLLFDKKMGELSGDLRDDYFANVSEQYVFVELFPLKEGDAWYFDGKEPKQISLEKNNITHSVDGQEYMNKNIPVIREVEIKRCIYCRKYFIISKQKNSPLHGLDLRYCNDCHEKGRAN